MKRLLYLVLAGLLVMACSSDKLGPEHRKVRDAAVKAYNLLIEGRYADFVSSMAYADSLPDAYRAELADLLADRSSEWVREHGGLWGVRAIGDTIMDQTAHVFLEIVYADSTREEVGLPMVLVGDDWKMQ